MTLRVQYKDFAATATRYKVRDVYVAPGAGCIEATAALVPERSILFSRSEQPLEIVREDLKSAGFQVYDGAWSLDAPCDEDPPGGPSEAYIAAVAYHSEGASPGIWVDAYESLPSQVQVLRSLYDEFRETGELGEVPFEEFVRLASPNVVVVAPNEIQGYLTDKSDD